MTQKEFSELHSGDIVRSVTNDEACIISANYGGRLTAVRTYDLTNPTEWDLVIKCKYMSVIERKEE